jgi:hypothetical protein
MASEKTSPARHGEVSNRSQVAVVMGSDSDMAVMQSCVDTLKDFGVQPIVRRKPPNLPRMQPVVESRLL